MKVMPEKEKALALVCLVPGGIVLAAMEHFAGWRGNGLLIMIFSLSFTAYFPKQFIFAVLAWGGPVALLRILTDRPGSLAAIASALVGASIGLGLAIVSERKKIPL